MVETSTRESTAKQGIAGWLASRPVLCLHAALAVVWICFWLLCFVSPDGATAFIGKEGPLEHISHLILLGAVQWHALRWWFSRGRREHLVLAAMCFLILMEEVDWLQLYVDYEMPGFLSGFTGRSDRLNFHNTPVADVLLPTCALAYFLVAPLAARWPAALARLVPLGLRPLRLGFASLFWTNLALNLLWDMDLLDLGIRTDELRETMVAVQLLLVGALPRIALAPLARGPDEQTTEPAP